MQDTVRYAAHLKKVVDRVQGLDRLLRDEFEFKLTEVISAHASLFDRFCPFAIGDRVMLLRPPELSADSGWNSSAHFLIAGAIATVETRGYTNDTFMFGLVFDNESWLCDGVPEPVLTKHQFGFGERSLIKVPVESNE